MVLVVGVVLVQQWPAVAPQLRRLPVPVLAASTCCVLVAVLASMLSWRLVLAGLGGELPVRQAARIFLVGQLGKYLPGSVWPLLTQVALGRSAGVPATTSAVAGLVAMGLAVATGLVVGLVAGVGAGLGGGYAVVALVGAACALPFMLSAALLNRVVERGLSILRRPALPRRLSSRVLYGSQLLVLVAWLAYGMHIWLLARALGPVGAGDLVPVTGGYALAMTVGMLVVLAPAGAGVREAVLGLTLAPALGTEAALAVVLVSRLLVTGVDLVTGAIGAVSVRRAKSLPPGPECSHSA